MQTTGNTVLITGGGSGIGLALARKFLDHDNHVIIIGRNQAKLEAAQQQYPQLTIQQADMTRSADIEALVRAFPHVNVLVNNAGIQYNYAMTDEAWHIECIDHELDTNLRGPLHLVKHYLPHLLHQPTAAIVNITSGMSIVPKENAPVYSATKAGLRQYTKALRGQLDATSIKVFELIPALVDTEMTQGRGRGKLSPAELVETFWQSFAQDKYEIRVGKIKLLFLLYRFMPRVAENIINKQ